MEAKQQLDPSPSRNYVMDEQTISRSLASADSGMFSYTYISLFSFVQMD